MTNPPPYTERSLHVLTYPLGSCETHLFIITVSLSFSALCRLAGEIAITERKGTRQVSLSLFGGLYRMTRTPRTNVLGTEFSYCNSIYPR